jgi:2-polyprenyl-3-methyl-5-hydroxy-6-metoxy-1,4-benzoquinol methylase
MSIDKTTKTIEAYNKNAQKFVDKFLTFKPYQEKLAMFQQKYLTGSNMTVLDIGCGPGHHPQYLYSLNNDLQITGIDLSLQMLEIARGLAPDCSFNSGDMRNLTDNIKYDAIIASFCIVHLTEAELQEFIANLSRLLNPHGYLYLSFVEGDRSGFIKPDFFDDKIYFNFFQRHRIIELLKSNHFKINELYEYDYQVKHGSSSKELFIFAQTLLN